MGRFKELWEDRDSQKEYALWLMHYSKPYVGRLALLMLFQFAMTALGLVTVEITKRIIDRAGTGISFVDLMVCYLVAVLLSETFQILNAVLSTVIMEKFSFGIRLQIYDKIIHSDWIEMKKFHTGDLMTRLTSDASGIADGISKTIPSIIQFAIELLLVFCMLFYYSPGLALFSIILAPVITIATWILGKKLRNLQKQVQITESKYRSFMQESLANILIVKAFRNEEYSHNRLTQLREERFFWVFKKTKFNVATSAFITMVFQLGYILAFGYGAYQIYTGQITYGTMTVFISLVAKIQGPAVSLAYQIPGVISALASAGRIMELQELPDEVENDDTLAGETVAIQTANLTFSYEGDDVVINDCNLDIQAGEVVAIVGESGIGKTTLIRLIMSFMSSYQGSITLSDERGNVITSTASARDYIAYVPQGNTLFSGTIRENIQMGKIDATEEEMIEALKLAAGYDFVMELPQGIDTLIGERGHGISEGQAQRIAIARALIRKSPILILDEATSALDEGTELKVLEGLKQLDPKPTCIVVTHRKSILAYCDKELIIENKVVSEKGLK